MNSGVVRLDQRMSILLTMNEHRLQSLILFCFTHAGHNSIEVKLHVTVQAVNRISECGMWNLKNPIKYAHL